MERIYRVTTEGDCEGKSTREIAYAKGNQKDILRFYDSVKCKTENESDYRNRAVARSGCDFEKINPYDSSFESEELCEEYCDWKNKKESCT